MTWETVFQMVTLIIGSLGGGSMIMLAVTKWGSELLAAKIKTDIELKYKKEMALYEKQLSDSTTKLNALLQSSIYVTQRQYDLEMEIYKNAWKTLYELMQCMTWVEDIKKVNPQIADVERHKKWRNDSYSNLLDKLKEFQKIADANAPFFEEDVYVAMRQIISECQKSEKIFMRYVNEIRLPNTDDIKALDQVYVEIIAKNNLLTELVRKHLQSLRCIPNNMSGNKLTEI